MLSPKDLDVHAVEATAFKQPNDDLDSFKAALVDAVHATVGRDHTLKVSQCGVS